MFVLTPVSTLTCPVCRSQASETIPTDSCQYFYECAGCKALLKPKAGDCCVFCSYGGRAMSVDTRSAGERPDGLLLLIEKSLIRQINPPFPFLRNVALLLHHSRLVFLGRYRVFQLFWFRHHREWPTRSM